MCSSVLVNVELFRKAHVAIKKAKEWLHNIQIRLDNEWFSNGFQEEGLAHKVMDDLFFQQEWMLRGDRSYVLFYSLMKLRKA